MIDTFGRYLSDHFGSYEIAPGLTHQFDAGLSTGPQGLQQLLLPLDAAKVSKHHPHPPTPTHPTNLPLTQPQVSKFLQTRCAASALQLNLLLREAIKPGGLLNSLSDLHSLVHARADAESPSSGALLVLWWCPKLCVWCFGGVCWCPKLVCMCATLLVF